MYSLKKILVAALFLLLISHCKKDWGTSKDEYYEPVDGPDYSELYNRNYFRVDFNITPEMMKIGSEVEVIAILQNIENEKLPVFYNWTIENSSTYYFAGEFFWFELFKPRINGVMNVTGYDENRIIVRTSVADALDFFGSSQTVSDIVREIGNLKLVLSLGYDSGNEKISYFMSRSVNIPIYY